MGDERFRDRATAGQALAVALLACDPALPLRARDDGVVVLGLPRGGVPVAAPVAAVLGAPLDALVVRKLGLPGQPELAMGALAGIEGRVEVIRNERVLGNSGISADDFARVLAQETAALAEREARFRTGSSPSVTGRTVVLVDDGLATGSTMRAAVAALRRRSPARVLVAVPVGAPSTCEALRQLVDDLVCLVRPGGFRAVGLAYDDFSQTPDEEVRQLLSAAHR